MSGIGLSFKMQRVDPLAFTIYLPLWGINDLILKPIIEFTAMSDPTHQLQVYRASDFKVVNGYNLGAPASFASELTLDDAYELNRYANPTTLSVKTETDRCYLLTKETVSGNPGNRLVFDCIMTMICTLGETVEIIVLVELDAESMIEATYILPLTTLYSSRQYILIGVDTTAPQKRFGEFAFVSFGKGTHITTADGYQKKVEDLQPGEAVLTRDDGPQILRWIGHHTVRAVGSFAPILIKSGVLNNLNDLELSADCRLLIYHRDDPLKVGRAEALIKARDLVDRCSVIEDPGGFVDYYQLLFDDHQIIFAEGIAVETLQLTDRSFHGLPKEVSHSLGFRDQSHRRRRHMAYDIDGNTLTAKDIAELLRAPSRL